MAQYLKETVKQRILESAIDEFYKNGYKSTTIKSIALGASIPAGLIYSYFKNKEALFSSVVKPVTHILTSFNAVKISDDPEKNLYKHELPMWLECIEKYNRELVILIDKSVGSCFENTKDEIISQVSIHLKIVPDLKSTSFDPVFYHILATNFMEGIFEIARHYQDRQWAEAMLRLLIKQHRFGTKALSQ